MNNREEGEHGESSYGTRNLQDPLADPGTSVRGRGRGRGRGRARGGRSQRSIGSGSRSKTAADLRARGGRGGRKRGCRGGVRPKQQNTIKTDDDGERDTSRDFLYEESPVVGFQEWNADEIADLGVTENATSSEYEIENDNNGVDEYDDDMLVDDGYRNAYTDVPAREYIGEYGLQGEEEEYDVEDEEEDEDEDEQGGVDVDGFFNDDSDVNGGGQIGNNPDDETELSSSGYSD